MFGNMGDISKMMKQMNALRKAKKELKKITTTLTKDTVTVTVNGEMKIVDLEISPEANLAKLPKLIKETVNEAFRKVQYDSAKNLQGMTDGLNLPGLS